MTNKRSINHWLRAVGDKQEGQAMVELALSFSLLTLFLMGAVEFGRVVYSAIEVSNAAHAAVQYGASSHSASGDWTKSGSTYSGGVVNAAVADAANVSGVKVTYINTACTCANTAYTPSSCSDNATCNNNNTSIVETITVNTQVSYTPLFQYPRSGSFTLNGSARQVVSNQ